MQQYYRSDENSLHINGYLSVDDARGRRFPGEDSKEKVMN
jgi:hypothetical protein